MSRIEARSALTPEGWARDVALEIDDLGRIRRIEPGAAPNARHVLLPAPCNLHSHAFQRGFAGMTEKRLRERDDFWSWRNLMYRFVERLTPEDVEALAALVFVESMEAGFAAIGEFHYVHHRPDGAPYDDPGELSHRIVAAAKASGIGLTHLPVLYAHGGVGGAPLHSGQRRFGADFERYAKIHDSAARAIARELDDDARIGFAPHSLRAVTPTMLEEALAAFPQGPIHIHAAEQQAEVAAIEGALGARPVRYLLDHVGLDRRWCVVHATHMDALERRDLARSDAVAGLCPITEANLGDGIFPAPAFVGEGGAFGVGSDQNVRISLTGELRTLEYGQRLREQSRCLTIGGDDGGSIGRALFERALEGGHRALGRDGGAIEVGKRADLLLLDDAALAFEGLDGDDLLDAWVFASDGGSVRALWSAGRPMVEQGRHVAREAIEARARKSLSALRAAL